MLLLTLWHYEILWESTQWMPYITQSAQWTTGEKRGAWHHSTVSGTWLESLWAIDCYAINVLSSLLCLRELPNSENTIILDKEVTQMNYNENYIMWRHSRHDIMFVELVSLNRPYLRNYKEFWWKISLATSSVVYDAVWIFSECCIFFEYFRSLKRPIPLRGPAGKNFF